MKALTLHRPWARYVASGHKRIENRGWAPPRKLLLQRFAIHAGVYLDHSVVPFVNGVLGRTPMTSCTGDFHGLGVIGLVTLIGWFQMSEDRVVHDVVGTELDGSPIVLTDVDLKWSFGEFCWVLRDAVMLNVNIPCRGLQKLWNLDADTEKKVAEALKAA